MKINKFFIAAVLGFCLLGTATSASAAGRGKRAKTEKSTVKRGQSKKSVDKGKTTLDEGKTTLDNNGKTTLDKGKTTLDKGKTTLDKGRSTNGRR